MGDSTKTYIGKCKGCKQAVRVQANVESRSSKGDYGRTVYRVTIRFPHGGVYTSDSSERAFFPCICGDRRNIEFRRLHGHVNDHKCSAKCLSSTGFLCECTCGGKNHGASHAA